MSKTLNEARMPSLKDKIDAQEQARLEADKEVKVEKPKKVSKKKK